jgi:diguanylate cyclase (GGDEF)-like protein/PAS domain S-box-containing protein
MDVNDQHRAESANAARALAMLAGQHGDAASLRAMLNLSSQALSAQSNGVLIVDATQPDHPIIYANEAFCRITGYALDEVLGRNCRFLQNADREQPALAILHAALQAKVAGQAVLRNYRKDGALFWNELRITPAHDTDGRLSHYIGSINDITARKQSEAAQAFRAAHDTLTGLPNRSQFNERLRQTMAGGAEGNAALLCLGIDNLTLINESLGHAAGEQLLRELAGRLLACVGPDDTVSRLSSDQFVILLRQAGGVSDIAALCESIFARLAPAFAYEANQMHVGCDIGIALFPQDGNDAPTLQRYAEMALSHARAQGDGKYQFFVAEMSRHTLERVGMETALRLALERGELYLMYQPLADLQSGQIASLEALVRWQHPTMGPLPARAFIGAAEDAGLIGALGAAVLQLACRDLRDWAGAGLAPVPLSINISPRQLRDPQLAGGVAAALREHGLEPQWLSLEIREASLSLDDPASQHCLAQLKALGVGLILDDFGTGYASLANLKRFPFAQIKLDHALISDIVTDIDGAALSKTIISMAHNLGMKVVAEGVETEAQCDFLRRNMCDLIQGYFFAPPMAAADIGAMRREQHRLPDHLLRMRQQERALLLVDDEQNILAALKRLLRRDDYRIFTASSGQEGLELLARQRIDVIVSDQRMPGMIGADFLRKAKQLYPETIRIMLSGYTELQSVTDAVNEGAIYKFLTKPWDDDLLRGHIAAAFQLKEISNENERLNLEVRQANHELAAANEKMEQLLQQKQQQISRDEISLNIARELLQLLPLPVIGMDDEGMIAFINAAAAGLFEGAGALLGNEACCVLPALFPAPGAAPAAGHHVAAIDGARYEVALYPMGAQSAARGSLITLNRCQEQP